MQEKNNNQNTFTLTHSEISAVHIDEIIGFYTV